MNKFAKKLACITLVGMIGTASLAGCGSKGIDGTKPLVTSGEDIVTVGTGNLVVRMNQAQMASYYAMMGANSEGMWSQQVGEGKTYGDSVKEEVVEQMKEMIALKQHAGDYEISLSEEEQKKIEEAAKAFVDANTEETLQKLAVTQADMEQLMILYTYQNKMRSPMTADVDTNVEDEEAAQSKVTYVRWDLSDKKNEDGTTTPLTEDEKQEKKDQAQELLDKLQEEKNPAEADMDALVKEINEDLKAFDKAFDDEYEGLDDKLKEAAKTLKDGEVYEEVIEGETAYFVVRMDHVLDREATDQKKEVIVDQRKNDAYNELLEKWVEETEFEVDEKEWKKVTLTDNDQYTIKVPQPEEDTSDAE